MYGVISKTCKYWTSDIYSSAVVGVTCERYERV